MKWIPGESGNTKGRPRGPKSELDKLREAVKRVEKEKGITLYTHFVKQAFKDNTVLTALAKKLVPDLKQIDGTLDKKQLNLLSISMNPELQGLIQEFLGQMARLELGKGKPELLNVGKKADSVVEEGEVKP